MTVGTSKNLVSDLDLGLDGPRATNRVVVAMSGGVDSSVTAALVQAAGYDVLGITLQLYDHGEAVGRTRSCCAGQDIHDARRVAEHLGIPHYVLDYESRFRDSVIDEFADAYIRGETPIPCIRCNQTVKFRDLLETARDLGAAALATGHYVRWVSDAGGPQLYQAVDADKDQSYFLFATTPDQLAFLRFPLGGLEKSDTRALAQEFGLPVAEKPDSQDICFVPTGDYAALVSRLRPSSKAAGEIVHLDGRVLGTHPGIIHYTVGQRRGIGVGGGATEDNEPLYVIALQPEKNRVVVGPRAALGVRDIYLKEVNWLAGAIPEAGLVVAVKVRSTRAPAPGRIWSLGAGRALVRLDDAEEGVSPGQACVAYNGARVLGGGWIMGAERTAAPASEVHAQGAILPAAQA